MKSFREILESDHSKASTNLILESIHQDRDRMDELMNLFCSEDKRLCQRAAWPIGFMGEQFPELLEPYFERMYYNLENPLHDAVIRNTLRTWHTMEIPEDYEGLVFDKCVNYFTDVNIAMAIRMFSMVIMANLSMKYPELKEEVIPMIEDFAPHGSVGLRSRAKKELVRLRK